LRMSIDFPITVILSTFRSRLIYVEGNGFHYIVKLNIKSSIGNAPIVYSGFEVFFWYS